MKLQTNTSCYESDSTREDQERKLFQLARLIGLPEDAICFVRYENWNEALSNADCLDQRPLVIELLAEPDPPSLQDWKRIVCCGSAFRHVFLFGSKSLGFCRARNSSHPPGRANGNPMRPIRFSDDAIWGPLQGLSENWPVSLNCSQIAPFRGSDSCWRPLITIGDAPWFLHCKADAASGFLWAGMDLPDLSEPLKPDEEYDRILRLLPMLAFLRQAYGRKIWHAPKYFANLTIDDPPVRDRYGSFAPAHHLASLADIRHATTLGFIPWNWNRSTAAAAEFFRSHSTQLSLCTHGCDHTEHEFASSDHAVLSGKCELALERIERLRKRTELSCEPVMIFPQGRFSKAAVAALREADFLAASASTLFPVDSEGDEVRLDYLLEPAFTRFEDFPIFTRRYPRDLARCAVDLYLGRALVLSEHQQYFDDGYEECRRFLKAMNRLHCNLSWAPLHEIVQRTCLQREIEPGSLEVRYYANRFILENPSSEKLSYRLLRRWNRSELIEGLLVNGSPVPYAFEDGQLTVSLGLEPRTSATIQIVQNRLHTKEVFKGSIVYRTSVWIRRILCDLRANQKWLSRCARWVSWPSNRADVPA